MLVSCFASLYPKAGVILSKWLVSRDSGYFATFMKLNPFYVGVSGCGAIQHSSSSFGAALRASVHRIQDASYVRNLPVS